MKTKENFKPELASNDVLESLRNTLQDTNSELFDKLGGQESLVFRVKITEISNDLYKAMKRNKNNGDESVSFF